MLPIIEMNILGNYLELRTYTLFMWIAIVDGVLLSIRALHKKGHRWINAGLFLISLSSSFVIGARILNYFVNQTAYKSGSISILTLKAVGFSFYGGIFSSIVFLLILWKMKKINLWEVTDAMILPFGISFAIMRMGCFLNGCCYGIATTCSLGIPLPVNVAEGLKQVGNSGFFGLIKLESMKVHPTQLYEGGLSLVGVIVLMFFRKTIKTPGVLTLLFGIYIAAVRWFVLYFRHLEYSEFVTRFFYPAVYGTLIIIGSVLLIRKIKGELAWKKK
ncbi:MAG: prolipoprotein diacylglyceryl transferase [Clostridiales bacterium]|nr:prolipoprotein diacylglyceryl transferase [Clostridiales bacterium]